MALRSGEAAFAAAIALLIIVLIAWLPASGAAGGPPGGGGGPFRAGPRNLGLYDVPYLYPTPEAPEALSWDGDRRCAAYCAKSPCAVWCR